MIELLSADNRIQLLAYGVLACTLVVPCLSLARRLRAVLRLPLLFVFGLTMLILGVGAEAMFFLTMISRLGAAVLAWIAVIVGTGFSLRDLRSRGVRKELLRADFWLPFAATAACGMTYLAQFALAMPAAGSVLQATINWLSLPNDNTLPHWLAVHIAAHLPPKPFAADWLGSDRPPLQAGFDVLFSVLVPSVRDSEPRYQAISVLLQASSLGALFSLSRCAGCAKLRSLGIVMLAWASGLFWLNSIFVWPKLIAAAYAGFAICIFMAPGKFTAPRALGIGCAAALGNLSHGAVMFTFPALVIAWLWLEKRLALRQIALALAIMLVLNAPWSWYQHVYDPPGDRLLKWHLAGQVAVTPENFRSAFIRAYTSVPFGSIVNYKLANLATPFGIDTTRTGTKGYWRAQQFFIVKYALNMLLVPYVAAFFFTFSRQRRLRNAAAFAWISLGGIVFWCLAIYIPSSTVVHIGSYLTMLLMFLAAGIVAAEWLPVFVIVCVAQLYSFGTTWLTLIPGSNLLSKSGLFAGVVCAAIVAMSIAAIVRTAVGNVWRRKPEGYELDPTTRYLRRNWRPLSTVAAVAVVLPVTDRFTSHLVFRVAPWSEPALASARPPPVSKCTDIGKPLASARSADLHGAARSGKPYLGIAEVVVEAMDPTTNPPPRRSVVDVGPGETVRISGWAVDPARHAAANVVAQVGSRLFSACYGTARPDVATVFGQPALTDVGFFVRVRGANIAPGRSRLAILVVPTDRRGYYVAQTEFIIQRTKTAHRAKS